MAPTLNKICREVGLIAETIYVLAAQAAIGITQHLRPPAEEPDDDEYAHFFQTEGDEYDCLLGVNGELDEP